MRSLVEELKSIMAENKLEAVYLANYSNVPVLGPILRRGTVFISKGSPIGRSLANIARNVLRLNITKFKMIGGDYLYAGRVDPERKSVVIIATRIDNYIDVDFVMDYVENVVKFSELE